VTSLLVIGSPLEADSYAAIFLVPENELFRHIEMQRLMQWHAHYSIVPSGHLRSLTIQLARAFAVTPSLMRKLLVSDLGILHLDKQTWELEICPYPLFPF
jgi:hypothetical protein